jgi:hypothetical protein
MENGFFMWGERGLVATFFLDLLPSQSHNNLSKFLKEIELANGNRIKFEPQKMWCIIEPNFGNRGFGQPDAIIVFENSKQEKIAILFEAKINKNYSQSSNSRGKKGFNSSINGQLELNYRLTNALNAYPSEEGHLKEPTRISNYYDKTRCLKDKKVIDKIVKTIVAFNIDYRNYYHVILTNDETNPLISNNNLPQLFDNNNINKWNELRSNFGWINEKKLKHFAQEYLKNGKFLGTLELNSIPL